VKYRLYGRQGSGSFAVQVALEEIGVAFERVWIANQPEAVARFRYVLGGRYSIADVYLYMLASWYPGGKEELYTRLPPLGLHAQTLSLRPAVSRVEADHVV
jgi:hypothetical protein